MRIVITGATGNAGTALLRRLATAKAEGEDLQIVGISRRHPDSRVPPYRGVEWHNVDVGEPAAVPRLETILQGADAVVHLVWQVQPNHRLDELFRTNVTGTANVLTAASRAGVGHFVCASSVGAYSRAGKDRRVAEDWPVDGIQGSHYSQHKAQQEALLNEFEAANPAVTVARLRPGLIFQEDSGSEVGKYFLGRLIPRVLPPKPRIPVLPVPQELVFQAVHADDVADAYWRVLHRRAAGAFNVAAEPVLDPNALGWLLGARRILPLPLAVLRVVVDLAWRARLQPTDAGWVDMAAGAPVMDTTRAREELGWSPGRSSLQAIAEVLAGLGRGAGVAGSPPLQAR
ncbi:UDP-glucose 4-epimerase [Arthrobacter sp. V4I6]|uniref:NAD-dependent epimerase/dehydratase family protein n=1 Tax=unclassified Arthrobacter TaxID=235627 RepID=UPI00278B522D|nr:MULTISPECIES: NAD-dependent epimerase/dehydratase family protein [unclassified Arthrobacter]MDQ0822710.1 UDP-glucose 4-epimerase [Arthrobacter sp. V1I7]MDQ0852338.1 UDP-glucose 4-epimerase [Arthrobacter sp. V4I6]